MVVLYNGRRTELEAALGRSYVCPHCGSGSGPKRTGALLVPGTKVLHCFVCGGNMTVLDGGERRKEKEAPVAPAKDYSGYYAEGLRHWKPSAYLVRRGITPVVQASYGMFEDDGHVVIPLSRWSYLKRALPPCSGNEKVRVGRMGGHFFGLETAAKTHPMVPLFVAEGEIDAASFSVVTNMQNSVALSSVSRAGAFCELVESDGALSDRLFVLAMDNDAPGAAAASLIRERLSAAGCRVELLRYPGADPNDSLANYRAAFSRAVVEAMSSAPFFLCT